MGIIFISLCQSIRIIVAMYLRCYTQAVFILSEGLLDPCCFAADRCTRPFDKNAFFLRIMNVCIVLKCGQTTYTHTQTVFLTYII